MARRGLPCVVVSILDGALAVSGVAHARRPARPSELATIVEGISGPSFSPPVQCESAYVSTLNASWAIVFWAGEHVSGCNKWASNGEDLVHLTGGRWESISGDDDWGGVQRSRRRCPVALPMTCCAGPTEPDSTAPETARASPNEPSQDESLSTVLIRTP